MACLQNITNGIAIRIMLLSTDSDQLIHIRAIVAGSDQFDAQTEIRLWNEIGDDETGFGGPPPREMLNKCACVMVWIGSVLSPRPLTHSVCWTSNYLTSR